jgi:hypothetical protein
MRMLSDSAWAGEGLTRSAPHRRDGRLVHVTRDARWSCPVLAATPGSEVAASSSAPEPSTRRRSALRGEAAGDRWLIASPGVELGGGRLLLYFPEACLSDGAAEVETGGYFDVENTPPWDSCIALIEDTNASLDHAQFLLACVPPAFLPIFARAFQVTIDDSLQWLTERYTNALELPDHYARGAAPSWLPAGGGEAHGKRFEI